jgi:hypothetical protein
MLTLACPAIFKSLGEKTLYVFGASNAVGFAMVWAFYPESSQRTLEEMDLLFSSSSWFAWDAEREFQRQIALNPALEHIKHGARGDIEQAPESRSKTTPEDIKRG